MAQVPQWLKMLIVYVQHLENTNAITFCSDEGKGISA